MKKETNLTKGVTETEVVDQFMKKLKYPLLKEVQWLRQLILATDKRIGEGIYWNAPTFYYTGKMKPFDPKEYKRYIVGFNFFKQDRIRLVFLSGAKLTDTAGIMEGDYKDGRRLVLFKDMKEIKEKEKPFQKLIKEWIRLVDK